MYSVKNAVAFLTLKGVHAALDVTSASNVAVYWGQNSYGDSSGDLAQQNLAYYCESMLGYRCIRAHHFLAITVIQLAFLDVINGEGGAPQINFANSGDSCTTFDGTALLNCPEIAKDIVTCQDLGKTILLSIGGATYSEGGFISEGAAIASAKLIWETFGPISTNTSINRPFGDSIIDGFDFDFESTVDNMPAFANELRALFVKDTSKTYYLTATPQCVYPDAADSPMLNGTVYFDAIWVQFYNNHCGINHFTAGSTTQINFNFHSWNTWATTISLNPDVKVFLGIPGGSATAGYESVSTIDSILDFIAEEEYISFGGIMIWDASQVYANNGFLPGIVSALRCFSSTKATILSTVTTPPDSTTLGLAGTIVPITLSTVQNSGSTNVKATRTIMTTYAKTTILATSTALIPTALPATTTIASSTVDVHFDFCLASGLACATSGTYTCSGASYGICDNGEWVIQQCASGLICVQDGSSIYCDFKGDHLDTTGSSAERFSTEFDK
ncbi:glycoside hydrolase superfamily [Penicillium longicatenatum]|uniref:glycoside hydrolase superfamily n=1 Tax=Penicillium longicatenatum TaxID=1561947 RepID=UPI0025494CE6|nr:glycoside hydrolase superfamily [Penicillium longicatenatum]KAJ5640307.1 glycoside hydrolase superfamily [Penicillium longicatenatum]